MNKYKHVYFSMFIWIKSNCKYDFLFITLECHKKYLRIYLNIYIYIHDLGNPLEKLKTKRYYKDHKLILKTSSCLRVDL